MKFWTTKLAISMAICALLTTAGCGGDSASLVDVACPTWNEGDSWTVQRTETVGGDQTAMSLSTYVVTQRTTDSVSVGNGITVKTYDIVDGSLIPTYEEQVPDPDAGFYGSTTTYSSTTAFCPPPARNQSYDSLTFLMGPFEGTGENMWTTTTVTGVKNEGVTLTLGDFTAYKAIMNKTDYWEGQVVAGQSTLSRYYVTGLGLVKEVEEIADTATVITDTLIDYDFDGPPIGTIDNPIVVHATPATMSLVYYRGKVSTGTLYIKMTGLFTSNSYAISLTNLSDNANLRVSADNFVTTGCTSTNTGTTNESCSTSSSATGELYIEIDGSQTTDGAYFLLDANT